MSERYFDQERPGGGLKRRNFLTVALASVAAVALPGVNVLAALRKGRGDEMFLGYPSGAFLSAAFPSIAKGTSESGQGTKPREALSVAKQLRRCSKSSV
jgi:hypothetical protein